MRNCGYLRNFSSVIQLLARKGHRLRIIFDTPKMTEHERAVLPLIEKLKGAPFQIEFDELLPPRGQGNYFGGVTRLLRLMQDYLRYFEPQYSRSNKLRERAAARLPNSVAKLLSFIGESQTARCRTIALLNYLDRFVPPPAYILQYFARHKSDLIMVTPLFGLGQHQPDYLKAARYLRLPSCLPVASWDNMTNKGLVHIPPDKLLVWNDAQKREAIELHAISPDRVMVTGAYCYDHWFSWRPSTTKEEFLVKVGLAHEAFILFLGSSSFIAPEEVPVVRRWATALRQSEHPCLAEVGILIRPHPQNATAWERADLSDLGNIAIYPRAGANPVGEDARADYFDSMYHSRVVVGANTTGMIEAAILGKPVHTVLLEEWSSTQTGTLHFQHLTSFDGGLLHVARDLPEHARRLSELLRSPEAPCERSRTFVSGFIRPEHLIDDPGATFAKAVEEQGDPRASSRYSSYPGLWLRRMLAAPLLLILMPEYVRSGVAGLRKTTRAGLVFLGVWPSSRQLGTPGK